jgi:uncharacterized membrane protein
MMGGSYYRTARAWGRSYLEEIALNDMKLRAVWAVLLGLLAGAAEQARADPIYTFTTFDVPGASTTTPGGINNSGQIVGQFDNGFGFLLTASVFSPIYFPGASSTLARGINDSGQIVGSYFDASGIAHGFLATPAVPEPSSFVLALSGVGLIGVGLAGLRRRATPVGA